MNRDEDMRRDDKIIVMMGILLLLLFGLMGWIVYDLVWHFVKWQARIK